MLADHLNVTIPEDLPALLEDFTIAVLKKQPPDLVVFAAEYFGHMRREREKLIEVDEESSASDGGDDGGTKDYGRRKSVAGERYDPMAEDDDESIVEAKTEDEFNWLLREISKIFLFEAIDMRMRKKVVNALARREVSPDEYIIRQGESGDYFYVIESGSYAIFIKEGGNDADLGSFDAPGSERNEDDDDGERVGTYDGQGSFGELALMYDQPRAATVRAVTDGVIWALDRASFRKIVIYGAYQRRVMFNKTLSEIPMLQVLTEDDRNNLVDALLARTYADNEVIIREGDTEAESMFFIEEGIVSILKNQGPGDDREIKQLSSGDYFGERALVTREPRQATAIAKGEVTLMELRVDAFERFLGPCMEIMKRNMSLYEEQVKQIFNSDNMDLARVTSIHRK